MFLGARSQHVFPLCMFYSLINQSFSHPAVHELMQTLRAFFHNNNKGDLDKDRTHKDKDRAFTENTRTGPTRTRTKPSRRGQGLTSLMSWHVVRSASCSVCLFVCTAEMLSVYERSSALRYSETSGHLCTQSMSDVLLDVNRKF